MRADATCGLGLKRRPISGPQTLDVGQVEGHFKGAALTLTHLHVLQALHHLQTVLWQKNTHAALEN